MADEIVYKKVTRKADKGLEGKVVAKHGKQTNQKLKPYVVLEYLMKYSDENNTKSAYDIIGYLEGCGISAERRSIYRDIEDINRIMLMLQEDIALRCMVTHLPVVSSDPRPCLWGCNFPG